MSYCRDDGACDICDATPDHCPDCQEPEDICICPVENPNDFEGATQ